MRKTGFVFLASHVLNAPLWALYTLVAYLLYKDLGGTPLQVTMLITLKPTVAILSFYWSSRFKGNVILASIVGVLPTLFFPFVHNNWFIIFSFALYFMTERAVIPAWMEILRHRVPFEKHSKLVSSSSLIMFISSSVVPIVAAHYLDVNPSLWRWMFPALALISLSRVFLQVGVGVKPEKEPTRRHLVSKTISLLRTRRDFAFYQLIFFFGGMGIMITQPCLPQFCADVLDLSYTKLALAIAVCKGIGFALTTRIWRPWIQRVNIYLFCGVVTFVGALFPLLVISSIYSILLLDIAYLMYGVMQAGSQLGWHMSGPIFSTKEDSSLYSGINILLVGIRGAFAPMLGALIASSLGAPAALAVGSAVCLMGTGAALLGSARYGKPVALPTKTY